MKRQSGSMLVALLATCLGLVGLTAPSSDANASALGQVRLAKMALVTFIMRHVDRPTHVLEPCPALTSTEAAAQISQLALVPSNQDYGPAVVFNRDVAAGLVALRCGVDLAAAAEPSGSVALSFDVSMLDGQATFEQLAVELAGNDVDITPVASLGGRMAGRCRNSGRECTTAVDVDSLVVIFRFEGLPSQDGPAIAERLASSLATQVITNLANAATER